MSPDMYSPHFWHGEHCLEIQLNIGHGAIGGWLVGLKVVGVVGGHDEGQLIRQL